LDETTIELFHGMAFVFLCLDRGASKKLIVERLEELNTPFIDVGMGLYVTDNTLGGIVRITTSTPNKRDHVRGMNRISFADGDGNNEYDTNIQIADLNALNAALAVVKWKKLFGFYLDLDHEHYTSYTIDGNMLNNDDRP
jgi:hypothetical protein